MTGDLYIGVAVGVLYAIALLHPVVFLNVGTLYGAVLPELVRFGSYRERRCAVQTACTRVHSLAGSVVLMLAVLAMLWLLVGDESWEATAPLWLSLIVYCLIPYVLGGALFWCFFRESIRRSLRQQLTERGVAICIRCGYDLRGQIEPRCPECGCAAPCLAKQEREEGR